MANLLQAHNTNLTLEALKMGESFNAAQLALAELLMQSVNGVIYECNLDDIVDHEVVVTANEPKGEIVTIEDPENQWGLFLQEDFENNGDHSILSAMNMSMQDPAETVDLLTLEYGTDGEGRVFGIPAAPTAAVATENISNDVDLVWVDNSDNEDNFEIQRKTGAGSFGALATVAADVEIYTDTTVAPGTAYTYRVRAVKTGVGNSAYVNSNEVTTAP